MKKLLLPLFAVLVLAACKNTNNAPADSQAAAPAANTTTPAEQKPITQVDVLQASAKAKTTIADLNSVIADLDAMPAEANTNYRTHIETLKKLAAEMLEKQKTIATGLETAAGSSTIANEAEVRTMISATDENARHLDGFRSRVEQVRNATTPK